MAPPIIKRIPVVSSDVKSVGYSWRLKILQVEFNNGGIYNYAGVPLNEYRQLMTADSIGQYFNQYIKTFYPAVKVNA